MTSTVSLRADEVFVIDSVAKAFFGTWRPGENPPDAYLTINGNDIAVEISTLTQHVTDDRGTRSRASDDIATAALANELNTELQHLIPDGNTIGLILSSPILKLRKTKAALATMLRGSLRDQDSFITDTPIEINGNPITIFRNRHGDNQYKKLSAIFMNRHSNPDIISNARAILEDRIIVKARKCASLAGQQPLWLALRNDYFLTDAHTYKYAFSHFSVVHPFEKILLVNPDGAVEPL